MSGMGLEEWCYRADVEVISVAGSVLAGRSMRSVTGKALPIIKIVTAVLS